MFCMIVIGMIFLLEYCVKKHMERARTLQEQRPLACGKVILKKYYNTGAAGNFLKNHPGCVRTVHISAFIAVLAALLYVMPKKNAAAAKAGLSFLAGGGLSNLHDRLKKGYVVDYVSFGFGPKWFQNLVFNIADFFVFAGIILCVIQSLRREGEQGNYDSTKDRFYHNITKGRFWHESSGQ